MPLCKEFEQKMIKYLWKTRSVSPRPFSSASTFSALDQQQQQQLGITPSVTSIDDEVELDEKPSADVENSTKTAAAPQRHWWSSWKLQPRSSTTKDANPSDPEKGGKRTERKLVLIGPIYAGCGPCGVAISNPPLLDNDNNILEERLKDRRINNLPLRGRCENKETETPRDK
jgi:hypothetical protein